VASRHQEHVAVRRQESKSGSVSLTDSNDLIPLTEPEARRLLFAIVWPQLTNIEQTLAWSDWRRRHQAIEK